MVEGAPDVVAGVTFLLWLAAAPNLASAEDVSAALHQLGDADLVLLNDPAGARPVRVLLATRVAASAEDVCTVMTDPSAYGKAMPSFRRVDVVAKHEREPGIADLEVAWELEVPLRNLSGKLWLRPQENGVDLQLAEGDFAPGLFHLSARKERPGGGRVRADHRRIRQRARRELGHAPDCPALAHRRAGHHGGRGLRLAEVARASGRRRVPARPSAAMAAPEPSSLNGALAGQTANATAQGKRSWRRCGVARTAAFPAWKLPSMSRRLPTK
jgi:hypothetical protein